MTSGAPELCEWNSAWVPFCIFLFCPFLSVVGRVFWGRMGGKLARPQREVYSQVKGNLKVGKFPFPKGNLKCFVCWLFEFFPDVSTASVQSLGFWDKVGEKLTLLRQSGGASVGRFFPLSLFISQLRIRRLSWECRGVRVPLLLLPLCLSPLPVSSVPLTLREDQKVYPTTWCRGATVPLTSLGPPIPSLGRD